MNRITLMIIFFSACLHTSYAQQPQKIDLSVFEEKIQAKLDSLYDSDTDFGGATLGIALPDGRKCGFSIGISDMEKEISMESTNRMLGGSSGKIFVSQMIGKQSVLEILIILFRVIIHLK